jgi:transcriptional regulator with XRE-family HTH domain
LAGRSSRHRIDETDLALGARIRARRLDLALSQTTLARAVGVSYQQIQKYERGVDRISVSVLIKLAGRLECSASSLVGEALAEDISPVPARLEAPGVPELLHIFSRIRSDRLRRRLLDFLAEFASAADAPTDRAA